MSARPAGREHLAAPAAPLAVPQAELHAETPSLCGVVDRALASARPPLQEVA
jgi:hypothetical protein